MTSQPFFPPPEAPATESPVTTSTIGTGGELYGDAHTTPSDDLINYPEDQDGVMVSPVDPTHPVPEPDALQPTDLSPGSDANQERTGISL